MRILWISRHIPQPAQVAALKEKFGQVEILLPTGDPASPDWSEKGQIAGWTLPEPHQVAQAVQAAMDATDASEVVSVMPTHHLAALTRAGIYPLRAVMERVPTGRVLENGEIEYEFNFVKFERVLEVIVRTEDL